MSKYRAEGSSLFMYSAERNAYLHVYRNDRLKSLKALIKAYEEECLNEGLND